MKKKFINTFQLVLLLFFFSTYDVHQDLGNIDKLEPGDSTSIYSRYIKGTGSDRSLYLQYPINKLRDKSIASLI